MQWEDENMESPFRKDGQLRTLRKGEYNRIKKEWKEKFGINIPTYENYKAKVKAEKKMCKMC